MEYFIHILVIIFIYMILSASANLVSGYMGIVSLAPAAFYGIGAYVAALMGLRLHSPFLLNVISAMVFCGACGALVGMPSLRIRDDFFVIATFAFQVIVFGLFNNWTSLTHGPNGLPGIPQPVIIGWTISSTFEFLLVAGVCTVLTMWICARIVRSPMGRVFRAIREDEVMVATSGKNIFHFKVMVFVLGAALSGLAGVIYAHFVSLVDPTSFTIMESIFILSIVIVGGAGSLWGPVIGAVLLVGLPELLRLAKLPPSVAANMRQILYGLALVACMMWQPQGLVGVFRSRRMITKSES